jgi:hypothetical protein
MKCYYHRSVDAIAVCCACGKGLCCDCIKEGEGSATCKVACQGGQGRRVGQSAAILRTAAGALLPHIATYLLAGTIISYVGIVLMCNAKDETFPSVVGALVTVLGGAFVVGGIMFAVSAVKLRRMSK